MRGTLARLRISGPMIDDEREERRKKMRNLQKAGCRLLHSFCVRDERREKRRRFLCQRVFEIVVRLRSIRGRRAKKRRGGRRGLFETIDGADRRWKRVLLHRPRGRRGSMPKGAEYPRQNLAFTLFAECKEGTQINQINTELVWELERKGDGWGEEIFPSLRQKRRVVEPLASKNDRITCKRTWKDYLVKVVGFYRRRSGGDIFSRGGLADYR